MTDLHDTRDLEYLYGPLYRFSDHKRGERISYRDDGQTKTGVILWCCAPGPVSIGGPALAMHYIVECDTENWPATVFPSDIVMERQS